MDNQKTEFQPDYTPMPGEILKEYLQSRGIKVTAFAQRCGRPQKTISEIIAGKSSISPETAIQFERVLGVKASMWLDIESRYQLQNAIGKEKEKLSQFADWIQKFPYTEMQNKGYLPKLRNTEDILLSLFRFFGVSSVKAWDNYWENRLQGIRYKRSGNHQSNLYAVASWLRRGEEKALEIECNRYDESTFKKVLQKIRTLTIKDWDTAREQLIELCRFAGVAVALVPDLSNTKLRGAAYWVSKEKAIIILSDRMKYEERLWFAFFHEAIHILRHSKKSIFVDYEEKNSSKNDEEHEADTYAASTIISDDQLTEFFELYGKQKNSYTQDELEKFAKKIRISPGLLLERLQWENAISYNRFTELKKPLVFHE